MAICAIMLAPLVLSISASLKTASEAAAIPPTYFTHHLSFESYQRLWNYQAGLPTYLDEQRRRRVPDDRLLPSV